ncbi:MAG: hypothetical protein FJ302_05925 [Planctomycetes bacterium]|nr:hypothetical protein [Planctomycetota bacterium]
MNTRSVFRCGRLLNRLRWATHLAMLVGTEVGECPFNVYDRIEELLVTMTEADKLATQLDNLRGLRTELNEMISSIENCEARADWRNALSIENFEAASEIEHNLFFCAAEGFVDRIVRTVASSVSANEFMSCESLLRLAMTFDLLVRPRCLFGDSALAVRAGRRPQVQNWLVALFGRDNSEESLSWGNDQAYWLLQLRRRVAECGMNEGDALRLNFLKCNRASRSEFRKYIQQLGRHLRDRFRLRRTRSHDSPQATGVQKSGKRVRPADVRRYLELVHDHETKKFKTIKQLAAAHGYEPSAAQKVTKRYRRWYDEAHGNIDEAWQHCCRHLAASNRLAQSELTATKSKN